MIELVLQWGIFVQLVWDANKSLRCLQNRGFDFAYAARIFDDPLCLTIEDRRRDYGESRSMTFGHIEERVFVVISTRRDDMIRIISARKANRREVSWYDQNRRKD